MRNRSALLAYLLLKGAATMSTWMTTWVALATPIRRQAPAMIISVQMIRRCQVIFRMKFSLQHIHQMCRRRRHLIHRATLDERAVHTPSVFQGQGGGQVPLPHLGAEGAMTTTTICQEVVRIIRRSQIVTGGVEAPADQISLKRQNEV